MMAEYTAHGHKLRFFTLRKPQFVTVPSIVTIVLAVPYSMFYGCGNTANSILSAEVMRCDSQNL